jgi:hypothetical protein
MKAQQEEAKCYIVNQTLSQDKDSTVQATLSPELINYVDECYSIYFYERKKAELDNKIALTTKTDIVKITTERNLEQYTIQYNSDWSFEEYYKKNDLNATFDLTELDSTYGNNMTMFAHNASYRDTNNDIHNKMKTKINIFSSCIKTIKRCLGCCNVTQIEDDLDNHNASEANPNIRHSLLPNSQYSEGLYNDKTSVVSQTPSAHLLPNSQYSDRLYNDKASVVSQTPSAHFLQPTGECAEDH